MKDFIEGEEWRDVVGYEGLYEVSNFGRVYSLPKTWQCKGEKVIRGNEGMIRKQVMTKGYLRVSLVDRKGCSVHRAVAMAFIPNPHNKPHIDHIDGNKSNNIASNLRWCTRRENLNFDNWERPSSTGVKGVIATKFNSYYYCVWYKNKKIESKKYKTIEETKIAYDKLMEELHQKDLLELKLAQ